MRAPAFPRHMGPSSISGASLPRGWGESGRDAPAKVFLAPGTGSLQGGGPGFASQCERPRATVRSRAQLPSAGCPAGLRTAVWVSASGNLGCQS